MSVEIKPNQDFKHGKKDFHKGRKYKVSEEDAKWFEDAGWIGDPKGKQDHSLDVHDVYEGHDAEVN